MLHSSTLATQSLSEDSAGCAAHRKLQEALQRRKGTGLTRVLPGWILDTASPCLVCRYPESGQQRGEGEAESTQGP